jgi:hypothetical protein
MDQRGWRARLLADAARHIMKRLLGLLLKRATALSCAAVVVAWGPIVALYLIEWESYGKIVCFILFAAAGVLVSVVGALLGVAAVLTSRRRAIPTAALAANLISLVWLLAVFA